MESEFELPEIVLPYKFKFSRVDSNGQSTQIFSSTGYLEHDEIKLGKKTYRLESIIQVSINQKYIALLGAEDDESWAETIMINRGDPAAIKRFIDKRCSRRWAQLRKEALSKKGLEGEFRAIDCKYCGATNDLTGFKRTPQVLCQFCDTIFTEQDEPDKRDLKYRICDECAYYGQPRPFTEFYLVFLVFFTWYSWETRVKCHNCMRRSAWKMVFANFIFILGLPYALGQLIRSYMGAKIQSKYQKLEAANAYAKSLNVNKASDLYEEILEIHHPAAGVQYNLALAHLTASNFDEALIEAKDALSSCANYYPAANIIIQALKSKSMYKEADKFTNSWGVLPGELEESDPPADADLERDEDA